VIFTQKPAREPQRDSTRCWRCEFKLPGGSAIWWDK